MSLPIPPKMPKAVQDVFERLRHLYAMMRLKWKIYRQMFGTSPARIDLLNNIAGTAFGVWQETMLDDMDLALSRLPDPMETGKKFQNLTLERLIHEVEKAEGASSNIVQNLRTLLQNADTQCKKSRERRNKIIAHSDLATNTSQLHATDRPSRQEIEEALKTLESMVNEVETYYGGTIMLYDHFITLFDGDSLIAALEELQRRRAEDPMGGRRRRRSSQGFRDPPVEES